MKILEEVKSGLTYILMSIIMMYMAVRVHAYKSEGAITIATPLSPEWQPCPGHMFVLPFCPCII